jgi:hypothetical protein
MAKSGKATTPATKTPAKTPSKSTGRTPSRTRSVGKQQRRVDPLLLAGGALIVLLVGLAIFFGARRAIPVAGEQRFPTQGNAHIETGQPNTFAYNSTPPTSGPHYGSLAPWGVHTGPVAYEYLIHNLEDGGIVIYYQCAEDCPEIRDQLAAIVEPYDRNGQHVALAPNNPSWTDGVARHQDMGAPIAVTAWTRIITMDSVDEERIQTFIRKYLGIDNHRGPTG